ncbi:galanin receptor type 1 [Silurus meridionalis]|uniref:galanin receptor type 1 n=1 Tax=Silurus meridionalis TaxID=175797 RepID=UPI001EEAC65C|nr:galanin receptor type 1 [Silurus meridionalis]KAI5093204.1 galanin receptor type 1-like [Silurus meridionalis]
MEIFLKENTTGQGDGKNISGPTDIERVLVPIFDTFILVTGTVGHILVIIIILRTMRKARGTSNGNANGTDILLLSLSLADILLLSCVPYHTVAIATRHWPFGSFMCKAVSFLGAACTAASAFTLATLASSRYVIVVHAARAYRWRRSGGIKLIAGVLWVPAIVLAIPQLTWRTLMSGTELRYTRQDLICFNFLSDSDQVAYGVCHFLFAFLLPLVVIMLAYGRIYHFLYTTRRNRDTNQTERLEQYQTQVTHTSVLLVLAFVLCWLPSYGLMLVQLGYQSTVTGPLPRFGPFATFARIMATSSTVVNPVLYVFMSQKFRKELKELVGKRLC